MKKNEVFSFRGKRFMPIGKILKIMKVFTFLMLVFAIHVSAVSYSQNTKLSMNLQNVTIKQVLAEIENQSEFRFLYSDSKINVEKIVAVDFNNEPIEDILRNMFEGSNIQFKVAGRQVLLSNSTDGFENSQQQKSINGKVTDTTGGSLPGVSVVIKGTTTGSITDFDGNFQLNIPSDAKTLVFSFVGMKTQEIAITGKSTFKIVLEEESIGIEEVVAIGYGTAKKSDVTGAISSVSGEDLSTRLQSNPAEALSGQVSGVSILRQGGNAGSDINIKIRGITTFSNNEPYCLVDGFPMNINTVNPSDIASIEVLKDGAAAAIYGSRAANGVILITTKNGKNGNVIIDVDSYVGISNVSNKLDMLDAQGYTKVHAQMYQNAGKSLPAYINATDNANTDWFDVMTRSGLTQNYSIGARGGLENSKYAISFAHSDEKGVMLGNKFIKNNARARYSFTKSIFTIDANIGLDFVDNQQSQYSLKEIYAVSPLVPVYDPTQDEGFGLTNKNNLPSNHNVMADYKNIKVKNRDYNMSGNISMGIKLAPFLNFKTSYGYRGSFNAYKYHSPTYTPSLQDKVLYPSNEASTTYLQEQVQENILTFNKEFNRHDLTVMLGNSINATYSDWHTTSVDGSTGGFIDQNSETIDAGIGGSFSGTGSNYKYNRASFFGRINYAFNHKYLFQVTARQDGSSKFGSNRRWGFFPSAAIGWVISQEGFFPKDGIINTLKFRASLGRLGNESALGYYDFQTLVTTVNNKSQGYVQGVDKNPWAGSISTGLANSDLQWETTDSKNIGFDLGLFKNRLTGSINYYNSTTSDLLITKVLAPSAGMDNPTLNVGKIRNSGIELDLKWKEKRGDFTYGIGLNLSTTQNRVLELANSNQVIYGTGLKYGDAHFPTQTRVGEPIGAYYLYQMDGIFQSDQDVQNHTSNVNGEKVVIQPDAQSGDVRFKDINGDGVLDTKDMIYSGTGIPKLDANLMLSLEWKAFDFSTTIGSAWGAEIYNGNRYFYEAMSSGSNFLASTTNAWTIDNHSNSIPRAVLSDPNGNTRESTRFLESGNFVKIRQIQIGYSLPVERIANLHFDKLRVFASINNVFTFTNYSGIDPEFSRKSVLDTGVDNFIFPFTRSYLLGVQIAF